MKLVTITTFMKCLNRRDLPRDTPCHKWRLSFFLHMCPLTSYKAEFNPGRWCAGLEYYIKRKIEVEARRKRVVQLCTTRDNLKAVYNMMGVRKCRVKIQYRCVLQHKL
ncbi:hypothetical protein Plhal304r1_c054g0139381 [Plasmopara halstedii]